MQQALWVLVEILVALVLAAAMMPIVRVVQQRRLPPGGWRLPRVLIVLAIYAGAFAVLALLVFLVG